MDAERRKAGIEVAKKWLDAGKIIGAKSMRVNSGGPRIAPCAVATETYPKADELAGYLRNCIESLKELADYGGKAGVKVTLENHWGLTANPMNIRLILDEVHHPFCEASPDFCNWEHEYLMYNGLKALAPYSHTNVHAKYWDREGQRRSPLGPHHDGRGIQGNVRARVRGRSLGWRRRLEVSLQGGPRGIVGGGSPSTIAPASHSVEEVFQEQIEHSDRRD
jgi:sugar phosphate isomerase/epimerase